jgi:hypothetical protein
MMIVDTGRVAISADDENVIGFVHRVIAEHEGLTEYAILLTDRQSIFIEQPPTRGRWMLRMETWFGSAVITDSQPRTSEDYANANLDSLRDDENNLAIPHERVIGLNVSVGNMYPVYRIRLRYKKHSENALLEFYPVPLGIYMRERRLGQSREAILRQYAGEIVSLYGRVLSPKVIHDESPLGA